MDEDQLRRRTRCIIYRPCVSSLDPRAELADALRNDSSALGEVFRRLEAGNSLAEVRKEIGDFAWSYDRAFKAILDGDLPTAPSVIRTVQRPFRRLLRDVPSLSPEAEASLRKNLAALDARLSDLALRSAEVEDARQATGEPRLRRFQASMYTHCRTTSNSPSIQSGHTLLKVGRSDRDVIQRFRNQIRTTALPEDPVLLRIYKNTGEDASRQERQIHDLLEAAIICRASGQAVPVVPHQFAVLRCCRWHHWIENSRCVPPRGAGIANRRRRIERTCRSSGAAEDELLLSESAVSFCDRDTDRMGFGQGVTWEPADSVLMPLGPRHVVGLSQTPRHRKINGEMVEVINAVQIRGSIKKIYLRPGSGLDKVIARHPAA